MVGYAIYAKGAGYYPVALHVPARRHRRARVWFLIAAVPACATTAPSSTSGSSSIFRGRRVVSGRPLIQGSRRYVPACGATLDALINMFPLPRSCASDDGRRRVLILGGLDVLGLSMPNVGLSAPSLRPRRPRLQRLPACRSASSRSRSCPSSPSTQPTAGRRATPLR